ncbi:MAG: pH-response regulator protein palH/rim21 [Icmadophila ericetorum]|nr:pH-response regulator protein palH/rim21 [Icmadophila ericetorum]
MLVIILFITPRTFFVGGVGGGFLGQRQVIGGAGRSPSVVGVGIRPWLQKVAAVTVAISLTIATATTFSVAEDQYDAGYSDAMALTDQVVGGLELRIIRVISDTFLWLAQVQTLIRLFPRHKEKVIIKWTGFALIVFDTIFSALDNFVDNGERVRPRAFTGAIPALSYLFELALGLLYAAWVMYYSLAKRRFAFFHPKMRNICLVAFLSMSAILVPVVFFVLDISQPDVAGWGDYFRWVGAAAASVVVWEWVERIEALERDERKGGILGREIFDGDEMLDVTPSLEMVPSGERRSSRRGGGDGRSFNTGRSNGGIATKRHTGPEVLPRSSRYNPNENEDPVTTGEPLMSGGIRPTSISFQSYITPPPPVASPINRADTTSAASTLYAVHYHPVSASSSPGPEGPEETTTQPNPGANPSPTVTNVQATTQDTGRVEVAEPTNATGTLPMQESNPGAKWKNLPNPFKRRRTSPPPEIQQAAQNDPKNSAPATKTTVQPDSTGGTFSRLKSKGKPKVPEQRLPSIVIPAQPRGRVWTPPNMDNHSDGVVQSLDSSLTATTCGDGTGIQTISESAFVSTSTHPPLHDPQFLDPGIGPSGTHTSYRNSPRIPDVDRSRGSLSILSVSSSPTPVQVVHRRETLNLSIPSSSRTPPNRYP